MKNNSSNKIERLKMLYLNQSKHSNYQSIPSAIKPFLKIEDLQINSRYENERMNFFKTVVNFKNAKVLDVGGNTGFFSFESIEEGAKEVVYIEGNREHSLFVKELSEITDNNIRVINKYLNFEGELQESPFDIVLLLNVIHHLGDDFGNTKLSLDRAKSYMRNCINFFYKKTKILILQLGFCWKGNIDYLLFKNGTKMEMIKFIEKAIEGKWSIEQIGIAESHDNKTSYNFLNENNIERMDHLGEFRNRPIFILKSL